MNDRDKARLNLLTWRLYGEGEGPEEFRYQARPEKLRALQTEILYLQHGGMPYSRGPRKKPKKPIGGNQK